MVLFASLFLALKGRQTTDGGVSPHVCANSRVHGINPVSSPERATDPRRGCKPPYIWNRHRY